MSELRGVLLVVVSSWPCELRHGASLYTFGHRAKAPRELGAAPRWQGQGRPLVPVRSWDRVRSLDISAWCFKRARVLAGAETCTNLGQKAECELGVGIRGRLGVVLRSCDAKHTAQDVD